jgi:hypothetical protein
MGRQCLLPSDSYAREPYQPPKEVGMAASGSALRTTAWAVAILALVAVGLSVAFLAMVMRFGQKFNGPG